MAAPTADADITQPKGKTADSGILLDMGTDRGTSESMLAWQMQQQAAGSATPAWFGGRHTSPCRSCQAEACSDCDWVGPGGPAPARLAGVPVHKQSRHTTTTGD